MRSFLLRFPRAAPWIDALFSSGLYTVLAWRFLSPPLRSHALEIIGIGVGFFVTTAYAQRRLRQKP